MKTSSLVLFILFKFVSAAPPCQEDYIKSVQSLMNEQARIEPINYLVKEIGKHDQKILVAKNSFFQCIDYSPNYSGIRGIRHGEIVTKHQFQKNITWDLVSSGRGSKCSVICK